MLVDFDHLVRQPVTLLIDSLDEVASRERNRDEFKKMLDDLFALAASDDATALRRVVLASRYGALRTLPAGVERVVCIAPLRQDQVEAYVDSLADTWKQDKAKVKQVVAISSRFGVNRSPLMLLMLCLLCVEDGAMAGVEVCSCFIVLLISHY